MMTLDASNPDEVQKLPDAERIVVVMEGLSMYLTNDALARFFTALQAKYKAVHVLLDIYTVFGAKASKYKNPINEVGVTQVYGIDDIHALVSDTGLRVVQECNMIPSHLVNELNGFDKVFFQRMFTGKTYQKIYRMYELATK
jgi:O-methyltransferase involved in polyketide biosynthesis